MRKNILFILLYLLVQTVSAVNISNFQLIADGWSSEYQKRIMNSKNEYLSFLNYDENLKDIESATLTIKYNNGNPLFILHLPYKKEFVRVEGRENAVGYLKYGTNGFYSTAFENIFDKIALIQRELAVEREDFGFNTTIMSGSLVIVINKNQQNSAIIQAKVNWNMPKLIINTLLEIKLNKRIHLVKMPYSSINEWGYMYGGENIDKLSGETNSSAIAFEKFFEISKADLALREENERKEKREKDYLEEEIELKSLNDTIYETVSPEITTDFTIKNRLYNNGRPLRKEDSFNNTYSLIVADKGNLINHHENIFSSNENEILNEFIASIKCDKPAEKEFLLHKTTRYVNSVVKFNLKLDVDNVIPFPIELILKKDKKTDSVFVSNKKKVTEVFKICKCDDNDKIESLINEFEGNSYKRLFIGNENKKVIRVNMRTYSFQYAFKHNEIQAIEENGIFYEIEND